MVGTRGSTQPNVAAQAFFSRSLLCHAVLILIRSFLVFTRFHVENPRACGGPNDGRASFDLILCLRFALSTPSPSLSCLLPYSLRHCQYLRQPRFLIPRFSAVLYSHAEHPVSEYVVSCEKRVPSLPVSFDFFCPLSSHRLLDSSSSRTLPFQSGHF
ncbi:hypothetical protein F5888DRAFT_1714520 [Russula emetica]|nr:hypothetical protein F5888DRAFT_1714520 [Russula emetica]